MGEEEKAEKKGGKKKKFLLWAMILGAFGAVAAVFKRKRGEGVEEGEWQELPPAEGG